ncbi:MAG: hypothetical protein AAGH15_22810 [Myxococcota bacterium]
MSGIWCDLAIRTGVPVVPVRFARGLPAEPVPEKLEYPVGMGRQDIAFGAPLSAEALAALPYKERTVAVQDAINALPPARDLPGPGDAELATRVAASPAPGVGLATVREVLRETTGRHAALDLLFANDGTKRPASASGGAGQVVGAAERAWLQGLALLLGMELRGGDPL